MIDIIDGFEPTELPIPTSGRGRWSDNFDYVEFDYADYDSMEYKDNIHSHQIYSREKGWLWHCFVDKKGLRCIEFAKSDPDGINHNQSIPYRLKWMKNAKFVRTV